MKHRRSQMPSDGMAAAALGAAAIPIAVVRLHDGQFISANVACRRALGLERADDLSSMDWSRLWMEGDGMADLLRRLATETSIGELEMWYRHPRAGDRRMLVAIEVAEIDSSRCAVVSFIDVTRRQQLRRELAERLNQVETLMHVAPLTISLENLDGELLWANSGLEEIILADGVVGRSQSAFGLVTSAPEAELDAVDLQRLEAGERVHREIAVSTANGEVRAFDVVKFPVHDADGVMYAIGTIGTDITERLRTDQALRQSEERFRQLAESLDEVFVLWAMHDTELLYISPAVTRVFGLPAENLSLQALFATTHPDDQLQLRLMLTNTDADVYPIVADYRIIRPDGEIRWIRSRTARVAQKVDQRERRSTTLLDITEQRRAEDAAIAARTEAEQANRAKSDFLSRMSHELRTPLNAVLGFAQLMQTERSGELRNDYVAQIIRAGGHLLGLIDEVLDIARIESGFLRLSLEPVGVCEVVVDAIGLVEPAATIAGLPVVFDDRDETAFVWADRQRLKQVLLNLLSNAVKYNSKGGKVTVSATEGANGTTRVTVADNGPGIRESDIAKLFLPFERLGAESSGVQGTGLGLALASQLADMMGGSMGADSTPGVGSRFWIELPSTPAPVDHADATAPSSGHAPGTTASDPKRLTSNRPTSVLLVEDNASNIQLVRGIFSQLPDVTLQTATHGRDALDMLDADDFDLILLDNHLPDTTGVELLHRIKADPRVAHLPVVMISADATAGQIETALAAGATSYLTKPIDVKQFLAVVDSAVGMPPAAPASAAPATASPASTTVLYVEDDEMNRSVMRRVFETYLPDVVLDVAVDGKSALSAVRESSPHLLIVDRGLPDMSGLSVISSLREQAQTASIPVLVLSGDPPPANWVASTDAEYLTKPYEIIRLVELVGRMLHLNG